ncbi:MAG: TIGR01777 family oxidoreductase [Nitrospirales bacterium]
MKVIVAGGTGFIGRHVCQTLLANQHEIIVLSRNPAQARAHAHKKILFVDWNGLAHESDERLDGVEACINLAGEPIADARWTPRRKQTLIDSRIITTRRLVEAIGRLRVKPKVLINASGIGFYGPADDVSMNESSPLGEGFLAELCQQWEYEANQATAHGVRVVCVRIGMVLGPDGGALSKMVTPFKACVGGPIAPGTQKVSWIHIHDLARLFAWLLVRQTVSGPVNAVSPHCVTMQEFCKILGKVLHRPSWLPVPGFSLKILLGELSDILTSGQQVEPQKITHEGFTFTYPTLEPALTSLFQREPSSIETANE